LAAASFAVGNAELMTGRVVARLRIDLSQIGHKVEFDFVARGYTFRRLLDFVEESKNDVLFLDLVDAVLVDKLPGRFVTDLERLLGDAGSAWRVADSEMGLERRVSQVTTDAFRRIATGNAEQHLKASWNASYGRHPQPSRAYSEAIKAVESACAPVVLPNDNLTTLGKIIGHMKSNPQRWQVDINPTGTPTNVEVLIGMVRLLWEGQTDRHGGSQQTVPISSDAAEAALHLAITLVQWFQSGVVRERQGG
jgi:hypothetical protein